MKQFRRLVCAAFVVMGGLTGWMEAQSAPAAHVFFKVELAKSAPGPLDGRLLVFAKAGKGDNEVDMNEFHPGESWIAAMDVTHLMPGGSVEIDADAMAYPKPFSALPAGDYEVQAVLDVDHTYNYKGRTPSDWISAVVPLMHWSPANAEATLTLASHPEEDPQRAEAFAKARASVAPGAIEEVEMMSPALTKFWGRPVTVRSWVVLPPGYAQHPEEKYPTVYWTHGFGGAQESDLMSAVEVRNRMVRGAMPPMIWVFLDESCPQGTHEFADSVNNGPWGTALTSEFIPMIETKYRMDARPAGRFLNGHSSGGWATLQLQVNYPHVFGGTWSTSPDPSDFHDFTGPDLYAAHANVYRRADGTAYPIMRMNGKVVATLEEFAQMERVIGPYGGQITSFEWVFSPKADSGAPKPMFDRVTGDVDPAVVAYWHEHYDLAFVTEKNWAKNGEMLRGRIHLMVGTADTFYLDGAAHRFEARLKALGAEPHFSYLPGRTHFDLYTVEKDPRGLLDEIGAEMYAVARPGSGWKKAAQ